MQSAGEYPNATTYTGVIAVGDLVSLSSGNIVLTEATPGNIGETDLPFGVFAGCRYEAGGEYEFRDYFDGLAGKTNIKATVLPLAGRLWKIRGASSVTWTAADVGTVRNLIYAAPATGRFASSRITLGAANVNGHAMIHGLWSEPGNGYTAAGVTEPVFLVEIVRTQGGLSVPYATT